ncbi:MAG: zf-HC2 domain-containing protein [Planctomycetota bacterium]
MKAHEKFLRLASRDLDGELDEVSRQALREHLQGCAACRRVVGELERLSEGLRTARNWGATLAPSRRITLGRLSGGFGVDGVKGKPTVRAVPVLPLGTAKGLAAAAVLLLLVEGFLVFVGPIWGLRRIDATVGPPAERVVSVLLEGRDDAQAAAAAARAAMELIEPEASVYRLDPGAGEGR